MSDEPKHDARQFDVALERIEAEQRARTGRLDIGNLGLEELPPALAEMNWLEELRLGGVVELGEEWVFRLTANGKLEATNEIYLPNRIDGFGAWLAQLSGLRQLDCSGAQLTDLAPLADLTALQSLNCSYTQVTELAPLTGLTALRSLDCRSTHVTELAPLTGLTALRSLDCRSTHVTELAPLTELTALQSLNCRSTHVTELVPLAGLTALQWLDCRSTHVTELAPLARLTALQSLSCRFTHVTELAPLAGLTALQSLNCSDTHVTELAPLASLTALQSLNCANTHVRELAPLASLTALQSLDCSSTHVTELAPLTGLTALQSLHCSHSHVTELGPLAGLTALQSLNCSDTHVTELGPLAGLTALQSLYCYNIPVAVVPRAVVALPNLTELRVKPHPGLADIPAEVLSQHQRDNCLFRLRAHFEDLETGATPLRDIKVIVLGNGRIGKTQLCRRLRGEPFEADADSTHGISVTSVELSMLSEDEPAVLNLWDFGGQDIYHGTHALFMRTRAVFVLLWTPDSEQGEHEHDTQVFRNHPLPYWLEYVRTFGSPEIPLILVQNQCDGGRGERANLPVDESALRSFQEDDRWMTRIAYSAKDDTGRDALMDALRRAVVALRHTQGRPLMGRNRLAVWQQLRAWRDADAERMDEATRTHRLIPYRDFEVMCGEQAIHSPETFAEVLHHAGMVFYQSNLFGNQLILDQSWALSAVYAVFTREQGIYAMLRGLGGRFTRSILDALLWRERGLSASDQQLLLDMMVASGICFVHRRAREGDETEYVAPDLLPEGPDGVADLLAARWDALPYEPLEASFVYDFLSPSIARGMLSDLGELAGATALYWRYGICLYDAASTSTAIVDEVPDNEGYGGGVRIRVKGANARTLLQSLIERITRLNERAGWMGQLTKADIARSDDANPPELRPATPPAIKPADPEVYVSYSWTKERHDGLVDELCDSLRERGLRILRDNTEIQLGDRISRYMDQLSAGRCVVIVLSADYLRSAFCMTELYRIYTNARQRDDDFLRRIVPLVQDDACIGSIEDRYAHAKHWKGKYDTVDALIRQDGAELIGVEDFQRHKLIGEFYRHVIAMLTYADDVLVPRNREVLSRDGFAVVRRLIQQALT